MRKPIPLFTITELPKEAGVYIIVTPHNKHFYIGSSLNIYRRRLGHLSDLKLQRHGNTRLQRVWDKYGNTLVFGVIEMCLPEDLMATEQKWLDEFQVASRKDSYNILPNAYSATGHPVSSKTRRKISKGKKGTLFTNEHKEKLRQAKVGYKQSAQHIENRTAKLRGKPVIKKKGYDSHGHRKFANEDVIQMRRLKAEGKSYAYVEQLFNVSHGGLMKIVARQTYRNI